MTRSRSIFGRLFAAASVFALSAVLLAPLAPEAQAQGRRMTQGGSGPIQVLLVTKGHAYDRENFFNLFDQLGETITWTHVEQPAAQAFWDPEMAKPFDVFVYFDAMGRREMKLADGTMGFEAPPQESKDGLEALLKSGKGMVFFHHGISAWNQAWDEYSEIVGGACDWSNPVTKRGVKYPFSGFQPGTKQYTSVVPEAKGHPIVEGLGDGFEIVDEAYACPYFEDSIHPLLRTDFVAKPENFEPARRRDPNWNHPLGSNLEAWYKAAENSPIVYIQHGHDNLAWANENFQKLMANAIKWAASEEALKWAKEHPQKIFK
jgi:type 1 glutamine amidotransferase